MDELAAAYGATRRFLESIFSGVGQVRSKVVPGRSVAKREANCICRVALSTACRSECENALAILVLSDQFS